MKIIVSRIRFAAWRNGVIFDSKAVPIGVIPSDIKWRFDLEEEVLARACQPKSQRLILAEPESNFDTIVIGSGMGGLSTASILAQVAKQRVLVLESHFKLGGFLHSFRRRNFTWDPGVHYVGAMQPGTLARRCMDLVTGGKVGWNPIGDPFERFVFPDEIFEVPGSADSYCQQLIDRFPDEAAAIRKYFRDVQKLQSWARRWFVSKQFNGAIASIINHRRRLASTTTREYLDSHFDNPKLKAVLAGQWMDYGAPPAQSAFGIHALIAGDYQEGAFYPEGGGQAIADAAVEVIERRGGRCLVNQPVKEILFDGTRAVGVRVGMNGDSTTFRARTIVSNAGAATTFDSLVPKHLGARERSRLSRCEPGPSAAVLYVGLKQDPQELGFRDCNYWLFSSTDHDRPANVDEIHSAFVSFGSLRDPKQRSPTCQIVTLSRADNWSEFAGSTWQRRGEEYEAAKRDYTNRLIDFVEARLPGLRSAIEIAELSSPLTVKSFLRHPRGQIYGHLCSPARLDRCSWSIGTSLRGLYLTGSDVGVPGVNSALMTGVMTAGKLIRFGMPRIFARLYS